MNKYLLVAFYVVAGCSSTASAEEFSFTKNSNQIWIELNSIIDENEVFLRDLLEGKCTNSSVAVIESCVSQILYSPVFALKTVNIINRIYSVYYRGFYISFYYPYNAIIRNTSIKIRAPESL